MRTSTDQVRAGRVAGRRVENVTPSSREARSRTDAIAALVGLTIACLVMTAAKLGAERVVWRRVQRFARPGSSIWEAMVRGDAASSGVAFVSGHVVLVAGLAWAVMPYLPRRWLPVPWASPRLWGSHACISGLTLRSASSAVLPSGS